MSVHRGETSQLLEILERVADGGIQVDVRDGPLEGSPEREPEEPDDDADE